MATRATWLTKQLATRPKSSALSARDGALELVPIPLALLAARDGIVQREVHNRAFARAGLLDEPDIASMVAAFLASSGQSEERDWQTGGTVERRHYRVNLSR